MINDLNQVYNFVFRGLLAEESLDHAGRKSKRTGDFIDSDIVKSLSLELMDDEMVQDARKMAIVYTAIATFENSVRNLVAKVLLDDVGENWWDKCVSERIRGRAEKKRDEEKKIKWHTQRGQAPIFYTTMGDLEKIISHNWDKYEPYLISVEWVNSIFDSIERSRNVIMHSGFLEKGDIERLGINIRDWIKQVGA